MKAKANQFPKKIILLTLFFFYFTSTFYSITGERASINLQVVISAWEMSSPLRISFCLLRFLYVCLSSSSHGRPGFLGIRYTGAF